MCVVSFIGDHFQDRFDPFKKYFPPIQPNVAPAIPFIQPPLPIISRAEFDELKKEVLQMKELLRKAKIYDEANNEPNCEVFDKMEFLKAIAKLVGIDLDDVLNKGQLSK